MYKTSENCSDDVVEAFKLDENFDYDNVMLTPKYSVAEMAMLANLLEQETTPSRVPYAAVEPGVSTCPDFMCRLYLPEAPYKNIKNSNFLYRSFINNFQAEETSEEVKNC